MIVEVWSDIICPFCMIGRAELAKALASYEHAADVTVVPRAYELHPHGEVEPLADYLRVKYGWSDEELAHQCDGIAARASGLGLTYRWRQAISAPTRDAHRLVKRGLARGLGDEVERALMLAHFTDGRDVSDHAVLREVAVGAGLSASDVDAVLAGNDHADEVDADCHLADKLGVRGTPFFVIDGRFAMSGAQPARSFIGALDKAREARAARDRGES